MVGIHQLNAIEWGAQIVTVSTHRGKKHLLPEEDGVLRMWLGRGLEIVSVVQ